MLEISLAGAALAGLLSFFSPCVLPMVPFYLCYLGGISMAELQGDTGGDAGSGKNALRGIAPHAQTRLIVSAVFFALGVVTIFMLLGMGATALGQTFGQLRQPLSYVAAAVLALFGLHFLGVVRIPLLNREARLTSTAAPTHLLGAYVMGLAFGFGWTPCVGPALASILMMASMMGEIWRGGLCLLTYGIGMTAPFVVAAVFAKPFLAWMYRNRKYLPVVEKTMGVMLLIFAALIATNSVNLIADVMIRYVPGFDGLG